MQRIRCGGVQPCEQSFGDGSIFYPGCSYSVGSARDVNKKQSIETKDKQRSRAKQSQAKPILNGGGALRTGCSLSFLRQDRCGSYFVVRIRHVAGELFYTCTLPKISEVSQSHHGHTDTTVQIRRKHNFARFAPRAMSVSHSKQRP